MPATEHVLFRDPNGPESPLWRYMDFPKYVDLLERRSLYFCRADLLGDPFEGRLSRANLEKRADFYADQDVAQRTLEAMKFLGPWSLRSCYVSCWHHNRYESAAMWRLYALTNQAIAIRTTCGLLKQVLPSEAHVGAINYRDYETDFVPEGNALAPLLSKRHSFSHESEVRGIISRFPPGPYSKDYVNTISGIHVPVDLDQLMIGVRVAPTAPPWFSELVTAVSVRYGMSAAIEPSELDALPAL